MARTTNIINFNMDKYLKQQLIEERSEQIYEKIRVKRMIKQVNKALKSLREEDLYKESVAVENLFNLLESNTVNLKQTKSGNVSIVGIKKKSLTQLTAITKAINEFKKNPTSTVKGMKELYKERKEELRGWLEDKEFVDSLGYDDLRKIYSVFQSNEYERTSKSFDSKSFFTVYTQAIDEKWKKRRFMREVKHYIDYGNDESLKEDIKTIYDDYIKNYSKR